MVFHSRQTLIALLVIGLTAGLFLLDFYIPQGVAAGVLYAGVVVLAIAHPNPHFPAFVAAICSVLTVLEAFLTSPLPEVPIWMVAANRVMSMIVIWVPVILIRERRKREETLRQVNDLLDQRVKERTRELSEVNKALVEEVMDRMKAEHALAVSREELRSLADRLLSVQDEERRRISRELHDDINQRLAMLAVEIDTLGRESAITSPQTTSKALRAVYDRLNALSDDVHYLAYSFHPSILDDLGLLVALRRLVEDAANRHHFTGCFCHHNVPDRIPQRVAGSLYRIAQESLGNASRHAQATEVHVDLAEKAGGLALSIRDNGCGFHPSRTGHHRKGLGLISMTERAKLMGGTFRLESRPGHGTSVSVWVPLTQDSI